MTGPQTEKALALHQDVLKRLQESDLEGILDALTQLYRPTAIADIIQAKIGTLRLHDFVRPTTEGGIWRVQEIKEDASGIRIKAAQHPNYNRTVSGPPDFFISLEARPTDKPENSRPDPALDPYQRFWIVTETLAPRLFGRAGLNEANSEFQRLQRNHYFPRFLGEKADDSLHDLSWSKPAISAHSLPSTG
ncbi:MAG: hypothetical protein AAFW75_32770 [Cyanobacteria bacterium J06636_16]